MKKYLGILALTLAIGLSAFNSAPAITKSEGLNVYWFKFIGTNASDPVQRTDPDMYEKQNGGERTCFSTNSLCEIHAEEASGGSDRPNLSTEDGQSYLP